MDPANESPPHRTTILGSLLRGRPRNSSIINTTDIRELSPSPPHPPSPGGMTPVVSGHRRTRAAAGPAVQTSVSASQPTTTTTTASLGLSSMLRRRRSAGAIATPTAAAPTAPVPPPAPSTSAPTAPTTSANSPAQGTHRIRLVPHIDSRRTLRFDAITRDLVAGTPALRIGRFTDRSGLGLAAVNAMGSNRLAFKSKVVSRAHAEIWVENGGRFFIKDTKSSSGTFLNHVRLSPANTESRPFLMKDGDILQLGVDYQGGTEDIYKSVKIRIELGREWQAGANAFNTNTLKILKTLQVPSLSLPSTSHPNPSNPPSTTAPNAPKPQIPDCCICLFGVTIRQALFIAPCSHTFHYKCIRPLLETHHPAFSCPLCRTFADLEEDVELEVEGECEGEEEGEGEGESVDGEGEGSGEGHEHEHEHGVEGSAHGHGHMEEMTPAPSDALVHVPIPLPVSVPGHAHAHVHAPIAEVEECEDAEEDEMHGVESEASASGVGVGVGVRGSVGGESIESPVPVPVHLVSVGVGVNELGEVEHDMDVEVEVEDDGDGTVAGKQKHQQHVVVSTAS